MALSHDPKWTKQADEATARRARENRPWPRLCASCEVELKPTSYSLCEHCFKEFWNG